MTSADLDHLVNIHGISPTRPDPVHGEVPISDETKRAILEALRVEIKPAGKQPSFKAGRATEKRSDNARTEDAVKCYLPDFLQKGRVWGISVQLYELRSERNWGIGDFSDLCDFVRLVGTLGGDFVGLNPLHAPFLADPDRCSPYEPSSRQQINPLYIAVDKVPGFQADEKLNERLDALRRTDLVDYAGVAAVKLSVLHTLWETWRNTRFDDALYDPADFEAFVEERGEELRRYALFERISARMVEAGHGAGWHGWPAEWQNPDSSVVAGFSREQQDDVGFYMWLQWLAHRQMTQAARVAQDARLRIGLYLDLAVGEALDGAAVWAGRAVYVSKATVGSPPDPFAADGQDWHLAAIQPSEITRGTKSPFRRMVDAAMRYAGAIRIDHAAALRRLFLVPIDMKPDGGAYVNYPQEALLAILAEASAEHRCLVIGEDLGLLPEGLQDDLERACVLSYRILSYERDENGFKPAEIYPPLSLACISTHDHQTLAGWWRGADIDARAEHGIVPPDLTDKHIEERHAERRDLAHALAETGAELKSVPPATAGEDRLAELIVGAHRFIARTSSVLAAVRLADLTGEKKPTNIPGTSDGYPNWRPKLSVSLSQLPDIPLLKAISSTMQEERPR